jgi:hypothetical protein
MGRIQGHNQAARVLAQSRGTTPVVTPRRLVSPQFATTAEARIKFRHVYHVTRHAITVSIWRAACFVSCGMRDPTDQRRIGQ